MLNNDLAVGELSFIGLAKLSFFFEIHFSHESIRERIEGVNEKQGIFSLIFLMFYFMERQQ